jgi:hypothetical protein
MQKACSDYNKVYSSMHDANEVIFYSLAFVFFVGITDTEGPESTRHTCLGAQVSLFVSQRHAGKF